MIIRALLLALPLFFTAACGVGQPPSPLAADSAHTVRELRTDFGTPPGPLGTAAVPPALARSIEAHQQARLAALFDDDTAYIRETMSTSPRSLQRLSVNNGLSIYALHTTDVEGEHWAFWLYDSTGKFSPTPLTFQGSLGSLADDTAYGLASRLPSEPVARIEDVDMDGQPEILLCARRHNGTAYDALVMHYYSYDADLRIGEMIRVEEWANLPMDTTGKRMQRTLAWNVGEDVFEITVSVQYGHTSTPVGRMEMSRDGKVLHRSLAPNTPYTSLLITCHPEGETAFFSFPEKQ